MLYNCTLQLASCCHNTKPNRKEFCAISPYCTERFCAISTSFTKCQSQKNWTTISIITYKLQLGRHFVQKKRNGKVSQNLSRQQWKNHSFIFKNKQKTKFVSKVSLWFFMGLEQNAVWLFLILMMIRNEGPGRLFVLSPYKPLDLWTKSWG